MVKLYYFVDSSVKVPPAMTVAAYADLNDFDPALRTKDTFAKLCHAFVGLADGAGQETGLPASKHADDYVADGVAVGPAFRERPLAKLADEVDLRRSTGVDPRTDGSWKAICSRLLAVSDDSLSDVDLLALLLSYLGSSVNSRELAGRLIDRFGSFGSVVTARSEQVADAADSEPSIMEFFALVRAAGTRLAREEICTRPLLDAWDKLIAYLRTTMAHQSVEQIRILFLDRCNVLIADEVQHTGTIDHTPVYPREVAKRALALDATAIIMVHNHPSNHPAPSKADIAMTRTIQETMDRLGVILHDHIIVSRRGHSSFRTMGLLDARTA